MIPNVFGHFNKESGDFYDLSVKFNKKPGQVTDLPRW
jgi:hypothetical protein